MGDGDPSTTTNQYLGIINQGQPRRREGSPFHFDKALSGLNQEKSLEIYLYIIYRIKSQDDYILSEDKI